MFDVFIIAFYKYGVVLVAALLLVKLIALIVYKPKEISYILLHLFIYHHRYVVRQEDYSRWGDFKIILNTITFLFHMSILCWVFSHCLYE